MKALLWILSIAAISASAQSREEKEIIEEGRRLYRTEMASWYGTNIFLQKFADKAGETGGYFSYLNDNRSICVFFSGGVIQA